MVIIERFFAVFFSFFFSVAHGKWQKKKKMKKKQKPPNLLCHQSSYLQCLALKRWIINKFNSWFSFSCSFTRFALSSSIYICNRVFMRLPIPDFSIHTHEREKKKNEKKLYAKQKRLCINIHTIYWIFVHRPLLSNVHILTVVPWCVCVLLHLLVHKMQNTVNFIEWMAWIELFEYGILWIMNPLWAFYSICFVSSALRSGLISLHSKWVYSHLKTTQKKLSFSK